MPNPMQELREILELQRQTLAKADEILRRLPPQFSLKLTLYSGAPMSSPITSLPVGGSAQLAVQLLQNGAPYVAPAGAPPYTFSPSVSSPDADISISPATADVTGGAVPLSQQFAIADASGDTPGSFDLNVTATAPDGSTQTVTLTTTLTPTVPETFSLSATLYPVPAASAKWGGQPAGVTVPRKKEINE